MTSERWHEIERLYHAVRAQPADVRASFLAEACPDPELRREVESLLAQPVSEQGLLDEQAAVVAA